MYTVERDEHPCMLRTALHPGLTTSPAAPRESKKQRSPGNNGVPVATPPSPGYPRHGLPQGLKHSTGTGMGMEATGTVTWVHKGVCHLGTVGPKGAGGTTSEAPGGPIVPP